MQRKWTAWNDYSVAQQKESEIVAGTMYVFEQEIDDRAGRIDDTKSSDRKWAKRP